MRIHLVVSVQHTGTWFLIHFLKRHVMTRAVVLFEDLYPGDDTSREPLPLDRQAPDRDVIVHMHVNRQDDVDGLPRRYEALQRAIGRREHRILVPLRDPLRSVITREAREPGQSHSYLVLGFEWLARIRWEVPVFHVPIDLPPDRRDRRELLEGVLDHCGLPSQPYVERVAKEWRPENSAAGQDELKKMYRQRNFASLAASFPAEWALLREKEPVLKPFLRQFGYGDLMWWGR